MADAPILPATAVERAVILRDLLITRSSSLVADDGSYGLLRREFMAAPATLRLLPEFMQNCRDLAEFWSFIRFKERSHVGRRQYLAAVFVPLLDHLEQGGGSVDAAPPAALPSFDAAGVRTAWDAALQRQTTDPAAALTSALALLETVCRHILAGAPPAADSLPQLYAQAAHALDLAPSQPADPSIRALLASGQQLVEQLATSPPDGAVSPAAASLSINLAGALATFLVEAWQSRPVR